VNQFDARPRAAFTLHVSPSTPREAAAYSGQGLRRGDLRPRRARPHLDPGPPRAGTYEDIRFVSDDARSAEGRLKTHRTSPPTPRLPSFLNRADLTVQEWTPIQFQLQAHDTQRRPPPDVLERPPARLGSTLDPGPASSVAPATPSRQPTRSPSPPQRPSVGRRALHSPSRCSTQRPAPEFSSPFRVPDVPQTTLSRRASWPSNPTTRLPPGEPAVGRHVSSPG